MKFINIENPVDFLDNMAGVGSLILFAKVSDIDNFPVLPPYSETGNIAVYNRLVGEFVMKPGKSFSSLYITPDTGEIKSTSQGSLDGKSYKHTVDISIPGNTDLVAGFARLAKNSGLILLIPDENMPDNYFTVGSKLRPAKIDKHEAGTGKKAEDYRGNTFTFTTDGVGPCPCITITPEKLKVLLGE